MVPLWIVLHAVIQRTGFCASGADVPPSAAALPVAAWTPWRAYSRTLNDAGSGDPHATPDEQPKDCEHLEHVHPQVVLYYMVLALTTGMLTYHVLHWLDHRFHVSIPYTVTVFVEGMLLGLLHYRTKVFTIFPAEWAGWSHGPFPCSMHHSINMWSNIDGHLLLFVFLPILLMGDSISLNWTVLKGCISQCLLLATLGVAIGAGLTAILAKFLLPYNWGWWTCITFGSILSATDPVAVVGLLNELGCSKVITMQIAGESLFNDGTAMVLFNVALGFMRHELDASKPDPTVWETIRLVFQLPLGAALMGLALGTFLCYCITQTQNRFAHSNHVLQLALPIVIAYWGYYVGDWEFEVSGVITTIVAAFCFGRASWPLVIDQHGMHTFWHMLEFFGNTLIFFLAGTLFGRSMCQGSWHGHSNHHIEFQDYGYCFLVYLGAILIRSVMVGIMYCPLKALGMGTNPQDAAVMIWGGLRGAVGLALAISVDAEFRDAVGAKFIFFVGGIAFLTLIINATTCGFLVTKLGMTQKTWAKHERIKNIGAHHNKQTLTTYKALARTARFKDHDAQMIRTWIHALQREDHPFENHVVDNNSLDRTKPDRVYEDAVKVAQATVNAYMMTLPSSEKALMQESLPSERELFYSIVRSSYWEMMNSGMLPENSKAVLRLLNSVDWAELHSDLPLCDFYQLLTQIQGTWFSAFREGLFHMREMIPIRRKTSRGMVTFDLFDIITFIDAHEAAHRHVMQLKTDMDEPPLRAAMAQVVLESREQVASARRFLTMNNIGEEYVRLARTLQLALHLLFGANRRIHELIRMGAATEADLHSILHDINHDSVSLYDNCKLSMRTDIHADEVLVCDTSVHLGIEHVEKGKSEVRGNARNSRYSQARSSTQKEKQHPDRLVNRMETE